MATPQVDENVIVSVETELVEKTVVIEPEVGKTQPFVKTKLFSVAVPVYFARLCCNKTIPLTVSVPDAETTLNDVVVEIV